MDNLDRFKKTFFEECSELLDAAYAHLGDLADGRGDDETMNAIFRAVHSIKGGGGAFGFDRLVAFAHALETLLDLTRSGTVETRPEVVNLLLKSLDSLADLVTAARTGEACAEGFEDTLATQLEDMAGSAKRPPAAAPRAKVPSAPPPTAATLHRFAIDFAPHPGLFQRANEPLLVLRELARVGTTEVRVDASKLPEFDQIDPEVAYLAWHIDIETDVPEEKIFEIFEFVTDDCDLKIESVTAHSAPEAAPPAATPEPTESTPALAPASAPAGAAAPPVRADNAPAATTIRVDVDKVDRVFNLVGELVISQAMLTQFASTLPPDLCPALITGLDTLSQHLRELQESVMSIRAQPVKSVFSRMPRLVREVAEQLGKDVRLVVSGEATEIDKTVIEQLSDPLTHLLRNALDHGIEMPDVREAAGKPRTGLIHLSAEHRSGRIVIEVSDDGKGIDRDVVLAKARDRGLVASDAALSREEIDHLIFMPGFSTAAAVSNISGRGVGMDVVKRNIQSLGGRIHIESKTGSGSRFILSLPLTLAVLDGMVIAVGSQTYILPITAIVESLRPKGNDIHRVVGHPDVLSIRGQYVPLVYLHRQFDIADAAGDPCKGVVVIVDTEGDGQVGIVADDLLGQQQVVVKSLEANYHPVEGVSGATILGDGRVALILDAANLGRFMRPQGRGIHVASASTAPH